MHMKESNSNRSVSAIACLVLFAVVAAMVVLISSLTSMVLNTDPIKSLSFACGIALITALVTMVCVRRF